MKYLWIIILITTTQIHAVDFRFYKVFDNVFQAPFSATPTFININNAIQRFSSLDEVNKLIFISEKISYDSLFDKDLIVYKKTDLDQMILDPYKAQGHKIISFESNRDINTKQFTFTLVKRIPYEAGAFVFQATQGIIVGKKLYSCSLQYLKEDQLEIFNRFKNGCKLN